MVKTKLYSTLEDGDQLISNNKKVVARLHIQTYDAHDKRPIALFLPMLTIFGGRVAK